MFEIFKSKPSHRATVRSFNALKKVWVGTPLSEEIGKERDNWEQRYRSTLKWCETQHPTDVLNKAIDLEMKNFADGTTVAKQSISQQISESDANTFAGLFLMLHVIENMIFAYVPAVAAFGKFDADRVAFDTLNCIKSSVENRRGEMHPEYAEGGLTILSSFLSELFEGK
jgi:hypothetical protein